MAQAKCRETLKRGDGRPLIDIVRDMVVKFDKLGVSKDMLENYIGYPVDNFDMNDIKTLGPIYNSLKDGIAKREDYFEMPRTASQTEQEFQAAMNPETPTKEKKGKKDKDAEQTGGDVESGQV
jgi:hypothetical protein